MAALAIGGVATIEGWNAAWAQTAPAKVTIAARRLTESQYRNTIRDVFGPDIRVEARFEPERRDDEARS